MIRAPQKRCVYVWLCEIVTFCICCYNFDWFAVVVETCGGSSADKCFCGVSCIPRTDYSVSRGGKLLPKSYISEVYSRSIRQCYQFCFFPQNLPKNGTWYLSNEDPCAAEWKPGVGDDCCNPNPYTSVCGFGAFTFRGVINVRRTTYELGCRL